VADFKIVDSAVLQPGEGEFLVRGHFLSVDPYMRGLLRPKVHYLRAVEPGDLMFGEVVGEVIESHHSGYVAGDYVAGHFGWQEFAVSNGQGVRKVDPSLAPISTALGVLGMPGLTAYFGLTEVGRPRAGESVFVSGGAGAVGSVVGQLARISGCRISASAGTDEKIAWLVEELGFNNAFNYKTSKDYHADVQRICPHGIDVYFDNVGGEITDAVMRLLNRHARTVICGQIAHYNEDKPAPGPRPFPNLLAHEARAEGFLVFSYSRRYNEALPRLADWVRRGELRYRETVAEGIDQAPEAFIGLFQGNNIGKQLVRLL
jgi:hypothetical protein